jgi:hypothetical protein
MARDNRKIVRAIRTDNTLYRAGQEDELGGVLKPEQVKRLTENGSLEGDWGKGSAAPKAPEAPEADATPAAEAKPAKSK